MSNLNKNRKFYYGTPFGQGAILLDEIIPCPYCGHEIGDDLSDHLYPVVYNEKDDKYTLWEMGCNESSGGCTATVLADTPEKALENWSMRAESPKKQQLIDGNDVVNELHDKNKIDTSGLLASSVDSYIQFITWTNRQNQMSNRYSHAFDLDTDLKGQFSISGQKIDSLDSSSDLEIDIIEKNTLLDKDDITENEQQCPFCKHTIPSNLLDWVQPTGYNLESWKVVCDESTGGCGVSVIGATAEEAISNWNKTARLFSK